MNRKSERIPCSLSARPLQNAPFCSTSASGSNFKPRNTQCIPTVKIFAFLVLESAKALWRKHFSKVSSACNAQAGLLRGASILTDNLLSGFYIYLETIRKYFRVDRREICFLRFIFEGLLR
jgi:hypothetical protein